MRFEIYIIFMVIKIINIYSKVIITNYSKARNRTRMDEFLARFAQRPHVDDSAQKRRQLFTVRVGVDEERGSHADADADANVVTISSKRFIVDRTAANEIDIKEFLDAIHKTTGIQLGKTASDGAFCSIPSAQKSKERGQLPSSSVATVLETFRIKKLGFKIVLKKLLVNEAQEREREREREEPHLEKEKVKRPYKKRAKPTDEPEKPVYETDAGIAELIAKLKASADSGTALSLKASPYYMNNRKHFTTFITSMFERYAQSRVGEVEAEEFDCSDMASANRKPFSLLYHQKIVREYLGLYSPYRGLLLYHGLGSGKTCSSIAIAEGLSSHKRIIVMTPASLQKNYVEEIKKCGNDLYKRDQHWVFHDLSKLPKGKTAAEYEKALLTAIGFPEKVAAEDNIVRLNGGGIWVAERGKPGNYSTLDESQRTAIDRQIDKMIRNKYKFINYNGIRLPQWRELMRQSQGGNYFDNAVIIVDEAHNLVSRIVNKLKSPRSLSIQMYDALLSANNSKIVLLTGTPIINYPNELGILFNILRGYINTFNFTLNTSAAKLKGGVNAAALKKMFNEAGDKVSVHDYLDFKQIQQKPTLVLTRNPFGFVSNRGGSTAASGNASVSLSLTHGGNISDADFRTNVIEVLASSGISVDDTKVTRFKALPDKMEEFNELFINSDGSGILNPDMFSRRIIGLTSYFRSAQEKLMPKYDPMKDFVLIEVEMSNHQFIKYKEIREKERTQESGTRKRAMVADLYADTSSTYRIFSRACCNFAFPNEIRRPPQTLDADEGDKGKKAAAADTEVAKAGAVGIPPSEVDNDKDKDKKAPKPKHKQMTERAIDGDADDDGDADGDDENEGDGAKKNNPLSPQELRTYNERIISTIQELADRADDFLRLEALEATCSPKFARIFENINDPGNEGLHLLYSQFRTLEGIGIFKLVMDANDYAEFNVQKDPHTGAWTRVIKPGDESKRMYALYTGTETQEKKELIRNIFNSSWDNLPPSLGLPMESERKNKYGDVIKLLMITASGAEGINLRNVRYVHIMEPYWHPVRTEQIIGRANRICSHHDLPRELQTVKVFLYVMKFTAEQLKPASKDSQVTNIIKYDSSITTDQKLLDTSSKKQLINQRLLTVVKASAIDCVTHRSKGGADVECFRYKTAIAIDDYAFVPNINEEQKDAAAERNVIKEVVGRPIKLEIDGVMETCILDESSQAVYKQSGTTFIHLGKLVQDKMGARVEKT
jgi:hypothetical protein